MQEETMLTADEGAWQVSEWKITQQQGDRAACDNDRLSNMTKNKEWRLKEQANIPVHSHIICPYSFLYQCMSSLLQPC